MKLLILVVLVSFMIGAIGAHKRWPFRGVGRRGDLPSCVIGGSSWYHADNARCSWYYQCYNSTISHFHCPPGEAFQLDSNNNPLGCFPAFQVNCGHRPYHPLMAPFRLIRVKITVQEPGVADVVYDIIVPQTPLIYTLRLLDQQDPTFSFASTSNPFFGEFITTINGYAASSTEYWSIRNPTTEIQLGVSSYLPHDMEHFLFTIVSFG